MDPAAKCVHAAPEEHLSGRCVSVAELGLAFAAVGSVGMLHVGVGPESELPAHTCGGSRSIIAAVLGPDLYTGGLVKNNA